MSTLSGMRKNMQERRHLRAATDHLGNMSQAHEGTSARIFFDLLEDLCEQNKLWMRNEVAANPKSGWSLLHYLDEGDVAFALILLRRRGVNPTNRTSKKGRF